jgi:hypothetical protein
MGVLNYLPGANSSYSFKRFYAGNINVGVARVQFPNIACEMVQFKADPDNSGQVYIGGADVTTGIGWQLGAGDMTGWIPISNVGLVYGIGSAASQKIAYMTVR